VPTECHVKKSPYECHVFVCINDRKGEGRSCADGNSVEIRLRLKEEAKKRWPSHVVRVSQSLCMGLCEYGPNVMIYPHGVWFSAVRLNDVDAIINKIETLLHQDNI
jgi:(2Fe-2S) ferredoxin